MKIHTMNFGTQTINADEIISFPEGFLGFTEQKEFKLFHEEKENPVVYWLQSITDKEFCMSLVTPSALDINYEISLTDEEQNLLKLNDTSDAVVALIVYKQRNEDNAGMKIIFKAPVIINIKDKLGMQKPLDPSVAIKLAA